MEYKFEIGDTAYINTRNSGIFKVKVVSRFPKEVKGETLPYYSLDRDVPYARDGDTYGPEKEEEVYRYCIYEDADILSHTRRPCPECVMMRIGDPFVDPFFGDMPYQLTEEMYLNS